MKNPTSEIKSFTDLYAWQESHKLALAIYRETKNFPSEEKYVLADQLKRAAISVTSNIAEGFSRNTSKDKAQFYTMAIGSIYEIQSQMLLARDLGYVNSQSFNSLAMLAISSLKLANKLKSSVYKLSDYNSPTLSQ